MSWAFFADIINGIFDNLLPSKNYVKNLQPRIILGNLVPFMEGYMKRFPWLILLLVMLLGSIPDDKAYAQNASGAYLIPRGSEYVMSIRCNDVGSGNGVDVQVQLDPIPGDMSTAIVAMVTRFGFNSSEHLQLVPLGTIAIPGIHRLTPRFYWHNNNANQVEINLYRARADGKPPKDDDIPIYSVSSSVATPEHTVHPADVWNEFPSFVFIVQ